MKDLLTTKELQSRFKVTRQTIVNWRNEGMPVVKLGRNIRFDHDIVFEWIKNNK